MCHRRYRQLRVAVQLTILLHVAEPHGRRDPAAVGRCDRTHWSRLRVRHKYPLRSYEPDAYEHGRALVRNWLDALEPHSTGGGGAGAAVAFQSAYLAGEDRAEPLAQWTHHTIVQA